MTLNIFITGATGYIGGAVLGHLLEHPERDTFRITALVRDAKKAATYKLRFFDKALAISSTFMLPMSPRASTSSMCFVITYWGGMRRKLQELEAELTSMHKPARLGNLRSS